MSLSSNIPLLPVPRYRRRLQCVCVCSIGSAVLSSDPRGSSNKWAVRSRRRPLSQPRKNGIGAAVSPTSSSLPPAFFRAGKWWRDGVQRRTIRKRGKNRGALFPVSSADNFCLDPGNPAKQFKSATETRLWFRLHFPTVNSTKKMYTAESRLWIRL